MEGGKQRALGIVGKIPIKNEEKILNDNVGKDMKSPSSQKRVELLRFPGRDIDHFFVVMGFGVVEYGAVHGYHGQLQVKIPQGFDHGRGGAHGSDGEVHAVVYHAVQLGFIVRGEGVVRIEDHLIQSRYKERIRALAARDPDQIQEKPQRNADHGIAYTIQYKEIRVGVPQMVDHDAQVDNTGKIGGVLLVAQNRGVDDGYDEEGEQQIVEQIVVKVKDL